MGTTTIDTSIFQKPIEFLSSYWYRKMVDREELLRELWNISIYCLILGMKSDKPNEYKITFSPTFYVKNSKIGVKSHDELISSLLVVLHKYGWNNPEIVPVLNNFKSFLEKYRSYENDYITIKDENEYIEGIKENAKNLEILINKIWSRPAIFKFVFHSINRNIIIPLLLTIPIFLFVLFLLDKPILFDNIKIIYNGFRWQLFLSLSLLLSFSIIFMIRKLTKNKKKYNSIFRTGAFVPGKK